mmetsp:Transcript_26531/g.39419  ORF Transcript_26531/g.39419 Transcript_26531/m.39419 type:complete len:586 (+) Transcript_26531:120-1877(+)
MTEVRNVSTENKGLFATKEYKEGDIILKEPTPIFVFASISSDGEKGENNKLLESQFDLPKNDNASSSSSSSSSKKKKKTTTSINSLESITMPTDMDSKYIGKFHGMVLAVCSYAVSVYEPFIQKEDEEKKADATKTREAILSLYHPTFTPLEDDNNKEEEAVIQIAKQTLSYCQTHANTPSQLRTLLSTAPNEAIQIMLLWSCNAFAGGYLYNTCSRINHSCNPNAIVVPSSGDTQIIQAVADTIQPNEEITLSYIGIFTYADGYTRRSRLYDTKHFICGCSRCTEEEDVASFLPCPSCHPRIMGQRYLEEDVQYDDNDDVHYAAPILRGEEKETTSTPSTFQLEQVKCTSCNEVTNGGTVLKLSQKAVDKITTHLLLKHITTKTALSSNTTTNKKQQEEESKEKSTIDAELEDNLQQMAISILGCKHWCANLLLLSMLERSVASFHSLLLLKSSSSSGNKDEDDGLDMTDIAEAIDSLQRLWTFTSNLKLHLHPSHLLCDVTIGVARTLVSLGDVKSQKYGADWVEKVERYVQLFQNDDDGGNGGMMIKVVDAIKNSWKRNDDDDDQKEGKTKEEHARKRLKTG